MSWLRGGRDKKVLKGRKEVGLTRVEALYYINLATEDKIQKVRWVRIYRALNSSKRRASLILQAVKFCRVLNREVI